MNKKIIGILVCMLVFYCTISTASVGKNKNYISQSNEEILLQNNRGEIFLNPPWEHAGWCNIVKKEGIADADCDASGDEYQGYVYGMVSAGLGAGGAQVNAHYYHQNPFPYYKVPHTGYYDFEFTYSYWGDFQGHVHIQQNPYIPGSWAELVTDIKINFLLYVDSNPPTNYEKEIVLEENSYNEQGDWFKDWDDTKTISFNDIYIEKNTLICVKSQLDINNLAAGAMLVAWAGGEVGLYGKLRQIKITIPNDPPDEPIITGPTSVDPDKTYSYSFTSSDPDGDKVKYYIKWGDGDTTGWTSYKASGLPYTSNHVWDKAGTYTIRAKAKDEFGDESDYGSLNVNVERSRSKIVNNWIIEFFQNMFPLLRNILVMD